MDFIFTKRRILLALIVFFCTMSFANRKVDSLLQNINELPDSIRLIHYKQIHSFYNNRSIDSAIYYAKIGLADMIQSGKQVFIVDMHIRAAISYMAINDFIKAQYHLQEALKNAEQASYKRSLPVIYNNLGILYASMKKYDFSLRYYNKAIKIDSLLEDWYGLAIDLSNMSEILTIQKEYKQARDNYLLSYRIYDSIKVVHHIPSILNNLGELYLSMHMYDSAIIFFNKSINLKIDLGQRHMLAPTYINLGNIYMANNNLGEAMKYFNKVNILAKEYGNLMYMQLANRGLATCYERIGNKSLALKYFKESAELKDSIFSLDKEKLLNELEIKYQVDKKEKEIDLLKKDAQIKEKETALQKQQKRFAIASAIILLVLLIMAGNRMKLRRNLYLQREEKLKAEARLKEEEALRKEEELKATAEINKINADRVHEELEYKNREITSSALYVAQKNEILITIEEKLADLKDYIKPEGKKEITNLKRLIKSNVELDEDWNNFKLHFEQVHPRFFESLSEKFPELTPNEQKICAYLRMNLSGKEIARLMNITPKSTQMSRYRLKKKFALGADDDLMEFIKLL